MSLLHFLRNEESKIILVDFNMLFVYKQFPIKCSFLMEDIRNTSKTLEYSVITYF